MAEVMLLLHLDGRISNPLISGLTFLVIVVELKFAIHGVIWNHSLNPLVGLKILQSKCWFLSLFHFVLFRLAGISLVVPYINYKWPSLPNYLTKDDYRKGLSRWAVMVARYAPGLLHWWLTQKLFPSSTVLDRNPTFFSRKDLEVLKNTPGYQLLNQVIFTSG